MATFKFDKVNAKVFQGGDSIVNQGPVVQSMYSSRDLADLFVTLRAEIERATATRRVPDSVMVEIGTVADDAEAEAANSQQGTGKLVAILGHLKNVSAGLASTAGIAEAADRIIGLVSGVS